MKLFTNRIIVISISLNILFLFGYSQQEASKPIYKIDVKRDAEPLGSFVVELFPLVASKHVAYFDSLVAIKFYDSLAFHRVVPGFVIQGGDPNSKHLPRETWGNGDTSQRNIPAEFNNIAFATGILGAARDVDINSANSQFFICVANAFSLNKQYTAYGRVWQGGMNIVDSIVNEPRDANDNPFKKLTMFVSKIGMNDSVPDVPVLLKPLHNAGRITTDSILIWSAVSGAVLYRLEIATDSTFTNVIFSDDVNTSSYVLRTVQLGLKKYYWRVSSNNGGHRSAFSQIQSFVTAIAVPPLIFPEHGALQQPANVYLKWNSVEGAVSYHLQVATNSIFSAAAMVFDQAGISDTIKQMSGLQLSKKHYWRVAASTESYEGAFSFQKNFTTGTSTEVHQIERVPDKFLIEQNYPNPFNPSTEICFEMPVFGNVSLRIFDLLGREVITLLNDERPAGFYKVRWNATGLPSGIYFYKLVSGSFVQTKKMLFLM